MNLPQSLSPVAMHLSDTQLYVSAQGLPFSYIDVPYEGLPHLLVYERESRIPGGDEQPEARDRDLLYALPLPLAQAPQQLLEHGNLLIAPASDGIAILNIANPVRPGVVQVLRSALVNGANMDLRPLSAHLEGDRLVVDTRHGQNNITRIVYDLSRPGAPQLSAAPIAAGLKGAVHLRPWMAVAEGGALSLHDTQQSIRPPMLGLYQPSGFDIPGNVSGLALGNSLAAIQYRHVCEKVKNTPKLEYHVQLLDISRPADIMFLDAMRTFDCDFIRDRYGARPALSDYSPRQEPVLLTDDGILVTAEESLRLTDTQVLDLASALPVPGAENVSLDTPIRLHFTHPVPVSSQESEHAYLSRYLSLLKDDGSADGVPVPVTLRRDVENPHIIDIVPDEALTAQSRYRVTLEADLAARRTEGLFDFTYSFTTGARFGSPVRILSVDTPFLPISGGPLSVRVAHPGDAPVFLVAGEPAAIADSELLDADTMRYTVEAPAAATPGAASLAVVTADGSRDDKPGSVIYVEPLVLNSIAPAIGNVDGGTVVTLKGRGLRADVGRIRVFFGNTEADAETVRLIDSDTLTVTAPAGALGRVDVRVQQDDGQSATLEQAFEYRQPPQSNIPVEAQVRDLVIDPTGTWAVAATSEGVMIVNIAASTWTGRGENPLLPANLLSMIDEDGNERDDRIEALVRLPDGWQAQRIALSFERGTNRVLVTAYRDNNGEDQGAMFILAFDPLDISQSTLVRELALPGDIARGLIAGGNRALVTLGSAGVGIVDTYLHTRAFLQTHMPLPGDVPALDIAALPHRAGTAEHYVVVGGRMDPATQRLLDVQQPGSSGFYVVGNDPSQGLHVVSSLDILGSTVSVSGNLAIVAAGDGGMVLVDVSDPTKPVIRGRVSDIGYVRDVSVMGHVVYVISDQGALAFDITDPSAPQRLHGQMAGDWQPDSVLATPYGPVIAGNGTISVLTDVVLKLIGIQPESGVLERQPDGNAVIRLRFNKAIDLHTPNRAAFNVTASGASVPHTVDIENNDALITVTQPHMLQSGDILTVSVSDALVAVKPVQGQAPLILHRLPSDQMRDLIWRGKRHDELLVDSVFPRRVVAGEMARLYVGVRGGSQDLSQVAMWLGSLPLTLQSVETSSDDARVMIYAVDTPALPAPGQYDLVVRVQRDGAADTASAPGAVTVDAPLTIDSASPGWGSLQGGDTVVIRGSGFEPGNSVMDGLKVTFGSTPVQRVEVLAHDTLKVISPTGAPGRVDVNLERRNGHSASASQAYGYGLRQLVHTQPSRIYPTDIHIDRDAGVAITTAGYFPYEAPNIVPVAGVEMPDSYRLATFDVQRREKLPLVGGVSSIPATGEAYARLTRWLTAGALAPSVECFLDWDCEEHRTPEQIALYERSVGTNYVASHDAVQLQSVVEREEGVMRQRVYVASGAAGVGRFNADDLNGMQLAGEQHYMDGEGMTSLAKLDDALYATAFGLDGGDPKSLKCIGHGTGDESQALPLRQYGYQFPEDPVLLGELSVNSGYRLRHADHELLVIGDVRHGRGRMPYCPWTMTSVTLAPGSDGNTVRIVDLLDPLLVYEHVFDDVVHDALLYGDYLIAAVGDSVLAVHRSRNEQRSEIRFETLQETTDSALALRRYGNLLLVSSAKGIYALDIHDPLAMRVISAGNVERAEQVDIFRDRLVVASGKEGLRAFELPGSFVQASSVDEQAAIPAAAPLVLEFNEAIDLDSLGDGSFTLRDLTAGEDIAVSITAEGEPEGDGVRAVRLEWLRAPGHKYALSLTELSNLRAGGLWLPYVVNFALAEADRQQPAIHTVENGARHRGESSAVIVHGEGFSASAEMYINGMPVPFSRIDETQLQIPPGALEMLTLQNGMHAIVVEDGPLQARALGAIVLAEAPEGTDYTMTPDSADVQGGNLVRIVAGRDVILPGSRVLLRGRYTQREIESGDIRLHDDVVSLREFTFWLPGVEQPEVFGVYLRNGDHELYIGEFSYQMEKGRELVLPNYPPMEIGAVVNRDELMYVGVAGGTKPSASNRYLMSAGVEIYDVTISDRPVRLSQLGTHGAITGLALAGDILWAAASEQGLLQISVHDPKQPMIVREEAVPGYSVTDVAFDTRRGWLAMSAATDLGSGIVRIIDTASDTLAPPQGVMPFAFVDGERAGRPVAVEWQGEQLFVLLDIDGQLHLASIGDVTDPDSIAVQDLDLATQANKNKKDSNILPGLLMQDGQLLVSGGGRLVTYLWQDGQWEASYWSEVDEDDGVLAALDGSLMISGSTGLQNTRQPNLALTGTRPAEGSTLGSGETVRLQFTDLINTDEVATALSFSDAAGNDLSAFVQVEPINTLRGGYIDVTASMPESSDFRIALNASLHSLDGRALLRDVILEYRYEATTPLRLSGAVNAASGRAFVHGDGSEQVV
ncbi:MAG TPA: hypothetical protein EYG20_08035, partial [Alcanivorax sp.]|nr:hypothetical protein [Alcanivorax sp.]